MALKTVGNHEKAKKDRKNNRLVAASINKKDLSREMNKVDL